MFGQAGLGGAGRVRARLPARLRRLLRPLRRLLRRHARAAAASGAGGRPSAPTSATTCGSPSRRRSAGPRRRSSSRSSTGAPRAPAPARSRARRRPACPQCSGRGEIRHVRQTMLGQMVNVVTCPRCRGEGKIVESPCDDCARRGPDGAREAAPRHDPGRDRRRPPDPAVRRGRGGSAGRPAGQPVRRDPRRAASRSSGARARSSTTSCDISIAQAALGTTVRVPTVDGEEDLEIKPGTQPGTEIRLRGRGAPHLRRAGARGDLHVLVEVVVPTKLSQRAARGARGLRRGLRASRVGGVEGRRPGPAQGRPRVTPRGRLASGAEAMAEVPGREADGLVGDDTWLELAVTCDPEAVEAVARSCPGSRPAGQRRAGLHARRRGAWARRSTRPLRPPSAPTSRPATPPRPRAAVDEATAALGHLQAFGLREIGELATRVVHESDWALGLEAPRRGHADRAPHRHPADLATPPARAGRRRPRP